MSDVPKANDASIKKHPRFGKLFDETPIPDHVEGFKLENPEEVHKIFPEGTDTAKEVKSPRIPTLVADNSSSCFADSSIPKPERSSFRSFPHYRTERRRTTSTLVSRNIRLAAISSMPTIRRDSVRTSPLG